MDKETIVKENLKNLSKEDWHIINNFIYGGAFVIVRQHTTPLNIKDINTLKLKDLCIKINEYVESCYDVCNKLNRAENNQGRFLIIDEVQLFSMLQVRDIFEEEIKKREVS